MTDDRTLWGALQRYVPRKKWIPIAEILATVQSRIYLDEEDLEHAGPASGTPRWESNVRRLLRLMVHAGRVRARGSQ
jgi:hypothetical protein